MAPPKQPPKAIPGFAVDSDDEVRRRSSKPDRTVRSSTHPLHPPPSFLIQADSDDGAMGEINYMQYSTVGGTSNVNRDSTVCTVSFAGLDPNERAIYATLFHPTCTLHILVRAMPFEFIGW